MAPTLTRVSQLSVSKARLWREVESRSLETYSSNRRSHYYPISPNLAPLTCKTSYCTTRWSQGFSKGRTLRSPGAQTLCTTGFLGAEGFRKSCVCVDFCLPRDQFQILPKPIMELRSKELLCLSYSLISTNTWIVCVLPGAGLIGVLTQGKMYEDACRLGGFQILPFLGDLQVICSSSTRSSGTLEETYKQSEETTFDSSEWENTFYQLFLRERTNI